MQTTKTKVSDREIADYWTKVSTPMGRITQNARLRTKRIAWKTVLSITIGIKRILDIIFSACALIAISPICVITAILIKLEDGGPILFKQSRIGYRGTTFRIWKFRSMVINAEEIGRKMVEQNNLKSTTDLKLSGDPRITKIGTFIRKYSIDELPQFWNVFCGDMSVAGPRPVVPAEVKVYNIEQRLRLLAKPGLTCFWQVGGRTDINFSDQVHLDVEYIRSESVWLDLKLLFLTIPAVLLGKGAY